VDTSNNRNKTNNDKSNNNEISRRGFLELGIGVGDGVAGVLAMTGIALHGARTRISAGSQNRQKHAHH
jgi:hypothetical protein